MIKATKYARKPFYVDAIQVTEENIEDVAKWCQGDVNTAKKPGGSKPEKYVKVRVHLPKTPRQTQAFVGDWVLYAVNGFKVFTPNAFEKSFEEIGGIDTDSVIHRSAVTGEFVSEEYAEENPDTTVSETPKAIGDVHNPFAVIPDESLEQGADETPTE